MKYLLSHTQFWKKLIKLEASENHDFFSFWSGMAAQVNKKED